MGETKRRLAAILAADVAGYSRLMGADEDGTVAALDACRAIFRGAIESHHGRVVDTAGDSVLATFESVVEAVRCSVEVQGALANRDADLADDRRMRFRIGVNLGDVIAKDDGTIYGDGVNVAARLESLAEPGGICLSGSAHEQVEGKTDLGFQDIGEHEVKNIARPVRAWRVVVDAEAVAPGAARALSDRPSIAVLAFENLSGDPEQEYFADGIAEDLITELSRLRWLLVTARNSTFTYKGRAIDVRQVGRDLGVRYVVEGSVRKGGERVRITTQLVDAATGNHIWAERYDRDLSDIFALQDEITETLVAALQGEVGKFERERAHRKPPESLDAWETYQRGMWHLWRMTAKDLAEACRLFQRAGDLDPNFAQAVAVLGYTLYAQVAHSYVDPPFETLEQALRLANHAIALDDKEAMAHFALGRVQTLRGEYDAAIEELRTAVDLNPSSALAHYGLALALLLTGQLEQAISESDTAIRLSPRDPLAWAIYTYRAWARFFLGDYEAAVEEAQRAIRRPSATFLPHTTLASALALLDRREEARIALDKLLEIKPDFSPHAALAAFSPLNPEALRPRFKPWIDGLRKAGLDIPDEPAAEQN
ncbi:MAG: tetratricopeptide repeat protein [Alphaproteobacteria bacterium]|nr:tetratricopeptide repeat protein [Alphaproteobacteria bacterium]MDP6517918.1 tetratricopeptide repeat protein [Alphaproteobacteria bacterium]